MKERKHILYQATNIQNGKRYIGITSRSLKARRQHHYSAARTRRDGCWRFTHAIRKYGEASFTWTTLATFDTQQEALKAEMHAIATLRPEYNVASGGIAPFAGVPRHTKGVVCLDDGKWFPSLKDAAAFYSLLPNRISTCCKGHEISVHGRHFSHAHKPLSRQECQDKLAVLQQRRSVRHRISQSMRSRAVICLTDGAAYPSARKASETYGIVPSRVMQLCQDGRATKNGLRFMYADADAPPEAIQPSLSELIEAVARRDAGLARARDKKRRPVICLDDGKAYASATEAAKAYGMSRATVWNAIEIGFSVAHGRLFKFVDAGDYL